MTSRRRPPSQIRDPEDSAEARWQVLRYWALGKFLNISKALTS